MEQVTSSDGATITFEKSGSRPPLVLVHGSLTNHITNWIAVKGAFIQTFTVYAIDRRGRGETSATDGHSTRDEFQDVAAVLGVIGEPAFLLGHSYGAHVALGAASLVSELVRKLVLYEPPTPATLPADQLRTLEEDIAHGDGASFADHFLDWAAQMPRGQIDAMKATPVWPMLAAEAEATLGDVHAFTSHYYDPQEFASLSMPILFLYGGESPPVQFIVMDALADVTEGAKKLKLTGVGHDGMFTNPGQFVDKVTGFLLQ